MANPAAVYCVELGYGYEVENREGGQVGVCVFPGGRRCDDWAFLEGSCGQEYSYCARHGMGIETRHDGADPFSVDYAVCTSAGGEPVASVTRLFDLYQKARHGNCSGDLTTQEPSGREAPAAMATLVGPADAPGSSATGSRTPWVDAWDWRDARGANWMTDVRNQGICGSCWAFSALGVVEAMYNLDANNPNLDLDLSEQYLVSGCSGAGTCCGGTFEKAFAYLDSDGVPDEGCLSYRDGTDGTGCSCNTDGTCGSNCTYRTGGACSDRRCSDRCSDWGRRLFRIYDWGPVTGDLDDVKDALFYSGPVAAAMGSGDPPTGSWDVNNIYQCADDAAPVDHGIVLVGFDESLDAWIVRNSWGANYNQTHAPGGYFLLGYGECNLSRFHQVQIGTPNDNILGALPITRAPYHGYVRFVEATTETDDPSLPCGGASIGKGYDTVWWRYTAPTDGAVVIDTVGPHAYAYEDTVLAIWKGSRGSLTSVKCDDDSGSGPTSLARFRATGGTTYYIEVAYKSHAASVRELHLNLATVGLDLDNDADEDLLAFEHWNHGSWIRLLNTGSISHGCTPPDDLHCLELSGYAIENATAWISHALLVDYLKADGTLGIDGRLDLVTFEANAGGGQFVGYRQTTSGTLVKDQVLRSNVGNPELAVSFDVDRDGDTDIMYFDNAGGAWYFMKNTGSRFAAPVVSRAHLGTPDHAVVIDYDRDGYPDLLAYESWNQDSTGAWGTWIRMHNLSGNPGHTAGAFDWDGEGPTGLGRIDKVLAVDYDNDHDLDIMYFQSGAWKKIENNGDGTFEDQGVARASLTRPDQAVAFDYDGDGWTDLLDFEWSFNGWIKVRNKGDGTFTWAGWLRTGLGREDCVVTDRSTSCYPWFRQLGYRSGLQCNGQNVTIHGTELGDKIVGTSGKDVIHGLGGNDTIWGLGGDDVICGGDGDDTLYGGDGNDRILGDDGTDAANGEAGTDHCSGVESGSCETWQPSPGAFVKSLPGDGAAGQPLDSALSWGTASGATAYEYCVDTSDDDACTASAAWVSVGSSTTATTAWAPATQYFWQVRAVNAYGTTYANGSSAAWWSLTTANPAPGDDFGSPVDIGGLPFTASRGTTGATTALDDPSFTCRAGQWYRSVWYRYTATTAAILVIDTFGSDYDTILGIWTGSRGSLVSAGCSDDDAESGSLQSKVQLTVAPGQTYYLEIASYFPAGGQLALNVVATPVPQSRTFRSVAAYDGWVLESGETTGVGGTRDAAATTCRVGDDATDAQYRCILHFNTSGLPDNAVITAVALEVKESSVTSPNPLSTHGNLLVDIKKPRFGTLALLAGDFQARAGKAGVGIFGTTATAGWYRTMLDASAFTHVNLLGTTQFRLRFALDDDNDDFADILGIFSGNSAVASRPKLIVEYYVP